MRLALYQPEIPQNAGTLLRLAACLSFGVDIIEPCGFVLSDRRVKRAGMDYLERVDYKCYSSWRNYQETRHKSRLILLTPHTDNSYLNFEFYADDILMVGQESCGVPDDVMRAVDAKVAIPMAPGERSINVAVAATLVLGEALRQTNLFPQVYTNSQK
jgi:tRNA (cytidine/uridine-2'-O-)-methyltransferase